MSNLAVTLCGRELKNPIIAASGTFGYGREYNEYFDIGLLGGVSVKGTTLHERAGNPPPRIAETPAGILNSVGLQNPGIDAFIRDEIPMLRAMGATIVANFSGFSPDEYKQCAERLHEADVDFLEVNISCPNVHDGGASFGASCESAAHITKLVRGVTDKPVIVKLTPNVANIADIAKACEEQGADGISLINTLLGMRIDTATRRPILRNNVGGLSGPAVFPIAVRMVWEVSSAVSIDVVGMGGINSGRDVAEMMLAGAKAVQVGTAIIADPLAPLRILEEFEAYLREQGISDASSLTGGVQPW